MITNSHQTIPTSSPRIHNPARWVVLLFACLCPCETGFADSGVNARQIFDGKTLDGWEGDPKHWRVEQGTIVGEIPAGQTLRRNTWLVWRDGELADFDLRLQVKLTGAPAANSGIQFRCQVQDVDHVSGYQADLDQGATWLGRIYDEHGRALPYLAGDVAVIERKPPHSVDSRPYGNAVFISGSVGVERAAIHDHFSVLKIGLPPHIFPPPVLILGGHHYAELPVRAGGFPVYVKVNQGGTGDIRQRRR